MKYLQMRFTKYVQDLHEENYKPLKREMEKEFTSE